MDIFLKIIAGILITVILYQVLAKSAKDTAILLSLLVCCMIASVAVGFLTPVIEFLQRLQNIGNLDTDLVQIMVRSVGIALLSQIVTQICADAGNGALGKALQILSATIILWIALPLFTIFIDLIEEILTKV